MKLYLSGPMTGYPQFNYPLFNAMAKKLRELGHKVYNPAEYVYDGPLEEFPLKEAFAEYCHEICLWAEAIIVLPGWQMSSGATCEVRLGQVLGIPYIPIDLFLEGAVYVDEQGTLSF